ncbi:MAG TPA: GNAT family N-acetyltransferase [Acidimicrobiales bacterium]|nr:GNAT family N-acetyltransferase [Acidimicrobiales bacterium]
MTGTVALLEVDDVIAAELRGARASRLTVADGFPRREDDEALRAYDRGALAYLVAEDGVVVGTCGTHGPPRTGGTVELGWGLVPGARGRGIGTTAVTQLLEETRRRFPTASIVAHTEWVADDEVMVADSAASEAILRRLGFDAEPPPTEPGYRAWRLGGT